jgi:threonine synthase
MRHYFHCIKCNKVYNKLSEICQHDIYYNFIEIIYDYERVKEFSLENKKDALARMLPLKDTNKIISLGEGKTPLFPILEFSNICKNNHVYVKNESNNPTGSFKDRETALVVSKAKELNYKKIIAISSGNAALSASVYANKANVDCECFVPKTTSKAKKIMLKLFSSKLHLMNGDYESIYRKVVDSSPKDSWHITSGKNFYREEGSKAISFEIWGSIGVPDIIIVPMGNGTLISAIYKGFFELKEIGLIYKLPKLVGVQIKDAAPISMAISKNKDYCILEKAPDSVAEGIIAKESYDSPKAIRAIKESNGYTIEVTDRETVCAMKEIIKKESLTPEPTSAVVYAALNKLKLKEKTGLKIVCIQTGNGMKNLDEVLDVVKC